MGPSCRPHLCCILLSPPRHGVCFFSLWIWSSPVTCFDSRMWWKMPGGFCLGTMSHHVKVSPLLERSHQPPDRPGTPGLREAFWEVSTPPELPAQGRHRSSASQHHGGPCDSLGNGESGEKEYCCLKPPSCVITQQSGHSTYCSDVPFGISKLSYFQRFLKQANSIMFF